MPNEENLEAPADPECHEMPSAIPAAMGKEKPAAAEELPCLAEDIDLNTVFPEEETDLNALFPEMEMKSLLKKVQKNKKDLNSMRKRFSDGI